MVAEATPPGMVQSVQSIASKLVRHREKLWWLHSLYALLFGIGVMWLGRQHFSFLRFTLLYILFIWATSLLLPHWRPRLDARRGNWLQSVVHYVNRNFYQQILFVILPIYYASTTIRSRNFVFLVLLASSAVLSTLDLVYDRYLSTRWLLAASFFAFNLFACVNLLLPILWGVSNTGAFYGGAMASFAGFATFCFRVSHLPLWKARAVLTLGGVALILFVFGGQPFIPPVPLRMLSASFGNDFDRQSLRITSPLSAVSPNASARIVGLTAIDAPLGLREQVSHRWYVDGKNTRSSPFYEVTGGRKQGFRLWTGVRADLSSVRTVRLDVVTEGEQLIGRALLPVSR